MVNLKRNQMAATIKKAKARQRSEDHRDKLRRSINLGHILNLQDQLIALAEEEDAPFMGKIAAIGKALDSRHKLLDKLLPNLQAVALEATVQHEVRTKEEMEEELKRLGVDPQTLRVA